MVLLIYNITKFQIFFIYTTTKLKIMQNALILYKKSCENFLLIDLLSLYILNKIRSGLNKISLDFTSSTYNICDKIVYIDKLAR